MKPRPSVVLTIARLLAAVAMLALTVVIWIDIYYKVTR